MRECRLSAQDIEIRERTILQIGGVLIRMGVEFDIEALCADVHAMYDGIQQPIENEEEE